MDYPSTEKKYHTAEHLTYSCQYHVIFCPKYRRRVLVPPVDQAVKDLFHEIADTYGFSIPDMEVMPDHVHLLISCNPRFGIMNCIRALKRYSAAPMREFDPSLDRRLPSIWTRSAFIATVGSVSLETVKAYIESQKEQ